MAQYRLTHVYDISVDPEDEHQLDDFPEWIREIEDVEDREIAMIECIKGSTFPEDFSGVSYWGQELEEV